MWKQKVQVEASQKILKLYGIKEGGGIFVSPNHVSGVFLSNHSEDRICMEIMIWSKRECHDVQFTRVVAQTNLFLGVKNQFKFLSFFSFSFLFIFFLLWFYIAMPTTSSTTSLSPCSMAENRGKCKMIYNMDNFIYHCMKKK
jgi:hypothetical protein